MKVRLEIGEKGKERANIRKCSTGRSIEARQDLHIRAHRDVGVRTHRCRCLCSCLGGEQWPHLEGHAGGVNIWNTHLPRCDPQYLVVMTSTPGPLVAEPGWLTNARGRKYNHKVPALYKSFPVNSYPSPVWLRPDGHWGDGGAGVQVEERPTAAYLPVRGHEDGHAGCSQ